MAICDEQAPRVMAYTMALEDASGMDVSEEDWLHGEVPPTLRAILCEAGRLYAPFMVANAAAIAKGEPIVRCVLDGKPYEANSFPYQGKCLNWLKGAHAALAPVDRSWVDGQLEGTGLEVMFKREKGLVDLSRL